MPFCVQTERIPKRCIKVLLQRISFSLFVLSFLEATLSLEQFLKDIDEQALYEYFLQYDGNAERQFDTTDIENDNSNDSYLESGLMNGKAKCKTQNSEIGVCVPYYLCDHDRAVINDGHGLIRKRSVNPCRNLDVCCQSPNSPIKTTHHENYGYGNPGANVLVFKKDLSPRNREIYANFGEFPWMVAIIRRAEDQDRTTTRYIGGGSLIQPLVVMTVAHKLENREANDVKIRAGEYDTNSDGELYVYQERNVDNIVMHQDFATHLNYNDIALLLLDAPVILKEAPHIGIGYLASQDPLPGTECFSMGWGAKNFADKKVSYSILRKVKLLIMGKKTCKRVLRDEHKSLFCARRAKGIDIDSCSEDEGAPLACPIDTKGSRFAIYGMVASNVGCGNTAPKVRTYVNVPRLHEWVDQQLDSLGLD